MTTNTDWAAQRIKNPDLVAALKNALLSVGSRGGGGDISKLGNRYLRAALFMPALVACQRQPNVKAFYEKLIEREKKPLQFTHLKAWTARSVV